MLASKPQSRCFDLMSFITRSTDLHVKGYRKLKAFWNDVTDDKSLSITSRRIDVTRIEQNWTQRNMLLVLITKRANHQRKQNQPLDTTMCPVQPGWSVRYLVRSLRVASMSYLDFSFINLSQMIDLRWLQAWPTCKRAATQAQKDDRKMTERWHVLYSPWLLRHVILTPRAEQLLLKIKISKYCDKKYKQLRMDE